MALCFRWGRPPEKDWKWLMDIYERHQKVWKLLYALNHRWICRKFRLEHEDLHMDGPVLLISNHVTNWDPLLVAMSLRDKQMYYVASEHIFRLGLITRILNWLFAPIPRRKASSGADTAWACIRHLRAGRSICLFAEGECCWDGRSASVVPATGKLAKLSKATLVTYRLEGGYLTFPRWARKIRRGRMYGHPVNIYSPDQLKAMDPEEIEAAINRDIYEDAIVRQSEAPVKFRSSAPADGLERGLYLCPECGRIGTLGTKGDRIFCDCGFSVRYTAEGSFSPAAPFAGFAEWDTYQRRRLRHLDFPLPAQPESEEGELLFSDDGLTLSQISDSHGEQSLGRGELRQFTDRLECAGHSFSTDGTSHMAMVKADRLLFTFDEKYYQIRAKGSVNLRKYLEFWKKNNGE